MFNVYKLDYTAEEINSKLGKVEYKILDEVSSAEETLNGLVDEGKYRFNSGDVIYSLTVECPEEGVISQSYWSTEEGIERTYIRNGHKNVNGEFVFEDWHSFLLSELASVMYASKDHTHSAAELTTNTEDVANARENLSTIGFITGTYNTVEEFWEAITAAGNYSKVLQTAFRFKDLGGWCPIGVANLWYQGFATWQNNPNSEKYDTGGVVLIWNGANSTMYRGTIKGNYTSGLRLVWRQVYDEDTTVRIANGGTGSGHASGARANLGLNPVKVWAGNQNTGSLTFDYGLYQFYLIRGFGTDGFIYSTMIVLAQEISSGISKWCLPLSGNSNLVFKLNRATEIAEDGTETKYVNLELDSTNTGSIMAVWGFN